jgi:hypothetical protein
MHPQINRELARVQQLEALRRQARWQAAPVPGEAAVDPAPRLNRRRAALSPLRRVARLQLRGH